MWVDSTRVDGGRRPQPREFLERAALHRRARRRRRGPARRPRCSPRRRGRGSSSELPSPSHMPIDHFVVVMMENRSFDHYFGWLGETASTASSRPDFTDPTGHPVDTRHVSTIGAAEWAGLRPPGPGPRLGLGPRPAAGGFMADGCGNDEFALTYYNGGELGFIHDAARAYTLYDRWFCSLLGLDLAEPLLQVVGAVGRPKNNDPPAGTAATSGRRSSTSRWRSGLSAQLLQLGPAVLGDVRAARGLVDAARRALLRGRRGGDAAEHHASSTRRSATAAASTATRPTSTRTATCGSGRRGWPTWSTRSSSRRTTSAARSSSSTTSGAGSSTT